MLRHLHIRDFAVVEELELEFGPGMTVFTGETGAGKSILIDALGLILGNRADGAVLRGDADRAEVGATFDSGAVAGLAQLLAERDLPDGGGELLLRRTVARDGRSRAFVNGSPVTVQDLRALGECLVDVHGQHEHQSLARREVQRELLDRFGGHEAELESVRAAAADWRECARRLEELGQGGADRAARLELLRYQVAELDAARPEPGEFEQLEAEHRRLANASRLLESLQELLGGLYDAEDSAHARLGRAARELHALVQLDAALAPAAELLESALIQNEEAAHGLRQYLERLDLDPARLAANEQRLDLLHTLARKHQLQPRDLPAHFAVLRGRLEELEAGGATAAELQARQQAALERYRAAAASLRARRTAAAQEFGKAISAELRKLGMPQGRFSVQLDTVESAAPQAHGTEQIEYQVSVNPGQPERPLARVASGGELSRISLAIQVVGGRDRGIPTLVFDEVDAGIGGAIAEVVGRLLRRLAGQRQVFCVTHLPQVAALATTHFQVSKSSAERNTWTTATPLADAARVEEIARMLGGVRITEQTRAHAREMLGASGAPAAGRKKKLKQ